VSGLRPVNFGHLSDESLEDVYELARALSRDARAVGDYSLAHSLNVFKGECARELNRRTMLARDIDQLSFE
jgi:hypothetical protein